MKLGQAETRMSTSSARRSEDQMLPPRVPLARWRRAVGAISRRVDRRLQWSLRGSDRASRSVLVAGCFAIVATVDALMSQRGFPSIWEAALDETAHLATTTLLLAWLVRILPLVRLWPMLLATVLIDLDHIPNQIGWDGITRDTVRPYSHSLLTVALVMVAAWFGRPRGRWIMMSIAVGISGHLLRDMATGGVPLLWPFSRRAVTLEHAAYVGLLAACAVVVSFHGAPPAVQRHQLSRGGRQY